MVTLMGYQPNLLAVAPSLPVKSVQELIIHARNHPGKLLYSSSGSSTPAHLGMEMFKHMTGTNIVHVPHKAAQQAIAALIAGQVQYCSTTLARSSRTSRPAGYADSV